MAEIHEISSKDHPTAFDGAAHDPSRKTASNILLSAAMGIGELEPNVTHQWIVCVAQINQLGPDHGKKVLEELNYLAEAANGKLNLLATQVTISGYCNRNGFSHLL